EKRTGWRGRRRRWWVGAHVSSGLLDAAAPTVSARIASSAAITSRVRCVGVDAPAVTPTRFTPLNQDASSSAAESTRYASLPAFSFTTCTSRRLLLLRRLPTTTTQ